jgi:hypothetical protein
MAQGNGHRPPSAPVSHEPQILKMKKDHLWTIIAIGLIMLVGTFAVVQGGIFSVSNLTGTAERWEFLMRQLRR